MTSHGKRWITALVALPVLAAIIGYGNQVCFSLLIYLVLILALREYFSIVLGPNNFWARLIGFGLATFVCLAAALENFQLIAASLSLSIILGFLGFILVAVRQSFDFNVLAKVIFGVFYLAFGFSHLTMIRQLPEGVAWVFLILVLGFAGDTLAFYVGRAWGKRKLLPAISPGKTVEGFLGLIAGSVLAVLIYRIIFLPALPLIHAVIIGFLGSITGQLGDLCESAIKRDAGVKDSGGSLPGHGGILDRIDCFLFIAPLVYYYRLFVLP